MKIAGWRHSYWNGALYSLQWLVCVTAGWSYGIGSSCCCYHSGNRHLSLKSVGGELLMRAKVFQVKCRRTFNQPLHVCAVTSGDRLVVSKFVCLLARLSISCSPISMSIWWISVKWSKIRCTTACSDCCRFHCLFVCLLEFSKFRFACRICFYYGSCPFVGWKV